MPRVPDDALLVVSRSHRFPYFLLFATLFAVAAGLLLWDASPEHGHCSGTGKYGLIRVLLCPFLKILPPIVWAAMLALLTTLALLLQLERRRKKHPMLVATKQGISFDYHGEWHGPIAWSEIKNLSAHGEDSIAFDLINPETVLARLNLPSGGNRTFLGVEIAAPDFVLPCEDYDRPVLDVATALDALMKARS